MGDRSASRPTVGVFDSGVGGLTVLSAIRRACPSLDLVYVADSGNAPYGNRTPAFIEARASEIARTLVDAGSGIIVVACNTATAVAVERLRADLSVPIVAMEPAIKPAVARTRSGAIGVLATERTLESQAVARLCRDYGRDVEILLQPCPGLVERVEAADLDSDATRDHLSTLIEPLLRRAVDTLVLGCTHFVFLESAIRAIAGPEVQIVESSEAVARETMRRLGVAEGASSSESPGQERFYTTGAPDRARAVFSKLWGSEVDVRAVISPVPGPIPDRGAPSAGIRDASAYGASDPARGRTRRARRRPSTSRDLPSS